MAVKKIQNRGEAAVDEMIEGVLAAYPSRLRRAAGAPRAIVARHGPRPGKVGLVIGGGSGHEPTFLGLIGRGLADAAAVGHVFASPPPEPARACAREVDGGAGVLFCYGNYAGDVMNFDMAAELCAAEGIEVRTVLTTDDVASAPPERRATRRGVAGNFFTFKIGGAACDRMWDLDACERALRKANEHCFTVGVALGPCALPQTLRPNFEIGADEIEVGMGIHGEPGVGRERLKPADAIVDDMLDRILAEMQPSRGERVAVLVNSLGATSFMELFIMNRRLAQRLADAGIEAHASWVGPWCTSLDMAGASITLLRLDGELTELLDHPCDAAMVWSRPDVPLTAGEVRAAPPRTRPAAALAGGEEPLTPRPTDDGAGGGAAIVGLLAAIAAVIDKEKDHLCALDGVIGDADHGLAMAAGFEAARRTAAALGPSTTASEALAAAAKGFLDAVGASSGPLYATAMLEASAALRDVNRLAQEHLLVLIEAFAAGVRRRGGAELGDKTMLDAWAPAAKAAREAREAGVPLQAARGRIVQAARTGAEATRSMLAAKGRAARLGERARGHVDPGAASAVLVVEALCRGLTDDRPNADPGAARVTH